MRWTQRPVSSRGAQRLAPARYGRYVDRSSVVLVFVSDGYFKSASTMRELLWAVALRKPLTFLAESDVKHGGLSAYDMQERLRSAIGKLGTQPLFSSSPTRR